MPRVPDSVVAEIKARVRLSELVGKTVKLQRSGKSMKGKSPFSNEKTPSFYVHDAEGYWKCFSSGKGGDAIAWLMETEKRTFSEAVEELAAMVGVAVREQTPAEKAAAAGVDRLHKALEIAQDVYTTRLESPTDERASIAREYLLSRGLGHDDWRRFGIGYAPPGGAIMSELRGAGFVVADVLASGVAFDGERGMGDLLRHRITFPVIDSRGRVVAFGGRSLSDDIKPKYLNSPATKIFDKGATLYGLHESRQALAKTGQLFIAEGYFDVIAIRRAGGAACAPMGTALTPAQLEQCWRLAETPIVCMDGDQAGRKAAVRIARMALPLLRAGRNLSFAMLEGPDPASVFQQWGGLGLHTALAVRKSVFGLLWDDMSASLNLMDPNDRGIFRKRCGEAMTAIEDEAVRQEWRYAFTVRLREEFPVPRPAADAKTYPVHATPALRGEGSASASWADIRAAALLAPLLGHLDRCIRHIDLLAEIPAGRFEGTRIYLLEWANEDLDAHLDPGDSPPDADAIRKLAPAGTGYDAAGWEKAAKTAIASA